MSQERQAKKPIGLIGSLARAACRAPARPPRDAPRGGGRARMASRETNFTHAAHPTISRRFDVMKSANRFWSQSPRFDLSTLRLRRMYRALASGIKSVVTGASLSGTTRSSQRRAGISHKSISAGIVGSSVWRTRCATAIVSLRKCNGGSNPVNYGMRPSSTVLRRAGIPAACPPQHRDRAVTDFIGLLLSISKNFDVSLFHGKTRGASQRCIDVWRD